MNPKEARRYYEATARELKAFRKAYSIPLRYLSKEIGVGHCTIHRFEHFKPIAAIDFIIIERWLLGKHFNQTNGYD